MSQINKWALVTGASSGIGKELCHKLADEGWSIILVARRVELMEKIKSELENKYQVKAEILKADLSLDADRISVITKIKERNATFLVNNAGVMLRGVFHEQESKTINQMLDLNLTALTHLTYETLRFYKTLPKTTPCYILNIGSVNSYVTASESAIYCATKSFVKTLTLALSEELHGSNIHCTCLCPGGTESELLDVAGLKMNNHAANILMKAEVVADIGVQATLKGKTVVVPGISNKLTVFFTRLVSERFMTFVASKVMKIFLHQ